MCYWSKNKSRVNQTTSACVTFYVQVNMIVLSILFLDANQQNQMVWELDLCGMVLVDLNA